MDTPLMHGIQYIDNIYGAVIEENTVAYKYKARRSDEKRGALDKRAAL